MMNYRWDAVLVYLRTLKCPPDGEADSALLERFINRRDETAFAGLVQRHGPLVWGVCERALGPTPEAEDAFQATWLVLLKQASSIGRRASVRAWLFTVARRVAVRAQAQRHLSPPISVDSAAPVALEPPHAVAARELRLILDEEVSRLPERLRIPVLLCDYDGKTNDEAARLLGCPRSTVATNLARARTRLRTRLARRGVSLSGVALTAALAQDACLAIAPALLTSNILSHLSATLTGATSESVVTLVDGATKAMFVTKVKLTAGCVAVAALVSAMLMMAVLPAVGQKPPLAVELRESTAPAKPATAAGEGDLQPDDVLAKAIKASREAAALTSFVGTAVFEYYVREPGQDEPMLRTKAKVKVFFDRGKYHLRFAYQTKLEFGDFSGEDLTKPRIVDGDPIKARLVERKRRDFAVISDGQSRHNVSFSQADTGSGCLIEIEPEQRQRLARLPMGNPSLLGKRVLDLEAVLTNLGRHAITISRLPEGGYRLQHAAKNSPMERYEYELRPEKGWNCAERKVFNPGDNQAVLHSEATWKQAKEYWFVERLVETSDYRRNERAGQLTRSVFYFESFEPGAEVDAKLFSPASLPVPPGQIQEIDHRPRR